MRSKIKLKKQNNLIIFILIIILTNTIGCIENQEISIEYFYAQPITINEEKNTTLSWNVTGAISVYINNDIGKVNHSDSIIVNPIQNTTYTLTASNENKIINSSINVIVKNDKKENNNETPKITITAKSFNENKSVLIKIKKISKFGIEWSTVSGKIIDNSTREIIPFINIDWKPNGIISEGDEIIIKNSNIKNELKKQNQYTFILTYQITNDEMGKITWIQ
jgi:hypothetical protein